MIHEVERSTRVDRTVKLKWSENDRNEYAEISVSCYGSGYVTLSSRVTQAGYTNIGMTTAAARDLAGALLEIAGAADCTPEGK